MDTPPEPDAPALDWRDALEPRIRQHVAYCQSYVTNHNHGAPGHLDRVTVDTLAKLLDGADLTHTIEHTIEINLTGIPELQIQIDAILAKYGGTL